MLEGSFYTGKKNELESMKSELYFEDNGRPLKNLKEGILLRDMNCRICSWLQSGT